MTRDDEHLRLLSAFHYVLGGLVGLFALFPVIHLVFGLLLVFFPEKFTNRGEAPPGFVGWLLVIFAAAFIAVGWALAGLILASGRFLSRRRHYLFCLTMAGIECIFMPIGTVLGVFTIVVLVRESVRQQFGPGRGVQPGAGLQGPGR